jgi:hypothetical protein
MTGCPASRRLCETWDQFALTNSGNKIMTRDSMQSQRQAFDKRQQRLRTSRNPKRRGELAELAFVHKATSLGFAVAHTYGDSQPYDFIVHSGPHFWKVQVKSSSALQDGTYMVNAIHSTNGRLTPYTPDEIDFLVAHIVPEDAWFVIPVQAFTPHKSIYVYPREQARIGPYEKYRDAWYLMA